MAGRFMFEGLRDKAGFLDETICRLGEAIAAKESIEEAPQEFFRSGPDSFYALGRICCDATTDGARLNAHSILLQGNQVGFLRKAAKSLLIKLYQHIL